MKVSLNTIKHYTGIDLPPIDELVRRINAQLGGVEEVVNLGAKYGDAKIVRVMECTPHPNADKLRICKIDAGTNELITVVCGAPNAHADMWAVWLPPESIVPSTYGDKEPFRLTTRELRGVMSNGMLAAGDELGINNDHSGIIELDIDKWRPYATEIKPGASFAAAYGLDDIIIDIENKMFTHRPDCFGQIGVAREIAGILGHKFISPKWYLEEPVFDGGEGLALEVFNDAEHHVPRFMAVALKNVDVKPSPLWLQCALVAMGSKPINNVVDATNYVMLLTAQPTHAYDYDMLRGNKIGARMAKAGETIQLLNGKTYKLTEDDIVIADGEGAIGLGGIMGGGNSEVSPGTKNIVLEVATFDMYAVRKTGMRHGVFTDALTRFNKGQSPLQNDRIMSLLIATIKDVASFEQASDVFDLGEKPERQAVSITQKFINDRLGIDLHTNDTVTLLGNVEVHVDSPDDHDRYFEVFPPFWRTDIERPEDIVEEVGRLYGFDALPRTLPRRAIAPAPKNVRRQLKQHIRDSLQRSGCNEVLSYSFIHERVMTRAAQDVAQAFRLSNALSPDLQYYRLSVLPSLLDKVHMNVKLGYAEFALFEIGKGHNNLLHSAEDGLPVELEFVDLVYTSKIAKQGAAYFQARRLVEQLAADLGFLVDFIPSVDRIDGMVVAPFEPSRSATIMTRTGVVLGVVGELKQSVQKAFKLPSYTAACSIDLAALQGATKQKEKAYVPLSKYPTATQDISLKVMSRTPYATVHVAVATVLSECLTEVTINLSPVSIYQSPDDTEHRTVTLHIACTSYDRTLTDDDISVALERVATYTAKQLDAVRI